MNVWKSCYDKVQEIGQFIKDSSTDIDGNHKLPLISKTEKKEWLIKIDKLLKESNYFLGKKKLILFKKKWQYKLNDPTTHASSIAFEYEHKMSPLEILVYGHEFMTQKPQKQEDQEEE